MNAELDRLVTAATGGDEGAFADVSRRYRRALPVQCSRLVGSFEDAEDLVQETLLRAWQKRESYEGRAPFRAWLYRIATNSTLDYLDKRKPERSGEMLEAAVSGQPRPEWLTWL